MAEEKRFCTAGWSKQEIFDQLFDEDESPPFQSSQISDEDAQWWVDENEEIMMEFPSEDLYASYILDVNKLLIERTLKHI